MKSQFYSKTLFRVFTTIYAIAIPIALLYTSFFILMSGWSEPPSSTGYYDPTVFYKAVLFIGIIPLFYIISSMLIVIKQQKSQTKWDYFLAPLLIISCGYFVYFLSNNLFIDIYNVFFHIPLDNILNVFIFLTSFILLFAILIPFYSFGKVLVRDLSKRKS